MKFLYVIACCMTLFSPNLCHASEIETNNSITDFDWLIADKEGNSQEIEKPVPMTVQKEEEVHPNAQIVAEVDAIATSMYNDALALWSSVVSLFVDDDNL